MHRQLPRQTTVVTLGQLSTWAVVAWAVVLASNLPPPHKSLKANASLVVGMSVRQSSSVCLLSYFSSVLSSQFYSPSVDDDNVGWWRLMKVDEGWWRLVKVDEGWGRLMRVYKCNINVTLKYTSPSLIPNLNLHQPSTTFNNLQQPSSTFINLHLRTDEKWDRQTDRRLTDWHPYN